MKKENFEFTVGTSCPGMTFPVGGKKFSSNPKFIIQKTERISYLLSG